MKNNMLKSFICFCLILILCLAAASCSGNADYSVEKKDGQTYIVFDDISRYSPMEFPGCILYVTGVRFNSVKDLKDTVTKGNLTEDQKRSIVRDFEKYEDNAVLTCDFDKLYNAKLPDNVSVRDVIWHGETYSFGLNFVGDIYGYLYYVTPSSYKSIFEHEYETFFDRDLIHVTETEDRGNGKTVTYYYTSSGKFKNIRYSMNVDGKTVFVDKRYTLAIEWSDMRVSYMVPDRVYLYCDEGDGMCWYAFMTDFAKDPTDKWLSEFGLIPYVEDESDASASGLSNQQLS